MSARTIGLIVALLVVLGTAGASWLFWIQNSARRVMLSLNLGFTKLVLAEPLPVPALMSLCFAVGLLAGMVLVVIPWVRAGRRARRDRQRAALGGDEAQQQPW